MLTLTDTEKLQAEYFAWLYENVTLWYIENEDLCAESVLNDERLELNAEQKTWLRDFIERWNQLERK